MAAPAACASSADAAIFAGVTGTFGFLRTESAEPVTAQVMKTSGASIYGAQSSFTARPCQAKLRRALFPRFDVRARWRSQRRWPLKRIIGIGLILCLPLLGLRSLAALDKPSITVFAAASLTDVLQELGDGFTKETSIPVRFSFAASSALARQIENGAPAELFLSADLEWMDYLQTRKLIRSESRHDVVGNRLVLIAAA